MENVSFEMVEIDSLSDDELDAIVGGIASAAPSPTGCI